MKRRTGRLAGDAALFPNYEEGRRAGKRYYCLGWPAGRWLLLDRTGREGGRYDKGNKVVVISQSISHQTPHHYLSSRGHGFFLFFRREVC